MNVIADTTRVRVACLALALAVVPSLLVGSTTAPRAMADICCEQTEGECQGGHSYCGALSLPGGVILCYKGAPLSCDE